MADSVKLSCLKNIKTTVEGITVAGGYNNTITNVQHFSTLGNAKTTMPMVEIVPGKERREEGMDPIVHSALEVNLILYHVQAEGSSTGTEEFLDTLYQDIIKALLADRTRGGYAIDTEITDVDPFVLAEGQIFTGMIFSLEIKFRTEPDDPTAAR